MPTPGGEKAEAERIGDGAVWRHGPQGAMRGRVCNTSGLPRCCSRAVLRCTVIRSGGGDRYAVWLRGRGGASVFYGAVCRGNE